MFDFVLVVFMVFFLIWCSVRSIALHPLSSPLIRAAGGRSLRRAPPSGPLMASGRVRAIDWAVVAPELKRPEKPMLGWPTKRDGLIGHPGMDRLWVCWVATVVAFAVRRTGWVEFSCLPWETFCDWGRFGQLVGLGVHYSGHFGSGTDVVHH